MEDDDLENWMSNVDEPIESYKKLHILEERIPMFESQGAVGFDMSDLGLVLGVRFPKNSR